MKKIKNLFEIYAKKMKEKPIRTIFYSVGIFLSIFFLLTMFISRGEIGYSVLPANPTDTFRDYYQSMIVGLDNPYSKWGAIYPPMCYVVYGIFSRLIPSYAIKGASIEFFHHFQGSLIGFTLYVLITIFGFILLCKKLKKGKKWEKVLFTILFMLSIPFLFQFERQNIIIVALLFLMIYFVYKDSKNKILKEIALISLAISAAIKIYPAIFGVLLIKNRQYKELIRVIIYGIIFTIVPFAFFGGFDQIMVFIDNLFRVSNDYTEMVAQKVSYGNLLNHIFSDNIAKIIYIAIIEISIFCAFICKSKWKTVLLLTCMMIGIPSISFTYTLIFLVIPLALFLDTKEKRTKLDYIYLALFILALFALPSSMLYHYKDMFYFAVNWSISSIIMSASIIIMTLLVCIESFIALIKYIKGR